MLIAHIGSHVWITQKKGRRRCLSKISAMIELQYAISHSNKCVRLKEKKTWHRFVYSVIQLCFLLYVESVRETSSRWLILSEGENLPFPNSKLYTNGSHPFHNRQVHFCGNSKNVIFFCHPDGTIRALSYTACMQECMRSYNLHFVSGSNDEHKCTF